MKNHSIFSLIAVTALALAVSGSFTGALAAGHGRAGMRQINRDGGSVSRTTTWTNAQGKTGTHTYQRTVDPVTKTATVNASTTLPDGRTSSRNLVSVGTDTGRHTTGQITGFNGRTATLDSTLTRTNNGFTRNTVVRGQDGKTVSTDVNVTRQDGTLTRVITRTGPAGGSVTKTQTVTRTVQPPPAG